MPDRRDAVPAGAGRPKLTADDLMLASSLQRAGQSAREIAKVLSRPHRPVHQRTISRWLRRIRQPNDDLRDALSALRSEAVDSWRSAMRTGGKQGRHLPAKELLVATGTIAEDALPRITIIVGDGRLPIGQLPELPALPAAQLPTIDAQPADITDRSS